MHLHKIRNCGWKNLWEWYWKKQSERDQKIWYPFGIFESWEREREVTMTDTLLDIEGYPISLYNILLYFFFLCCLTKLPILCLLIYSITATKLFNFHSFEKWVSKWNTCNKVDDNAKHSCYISCEIIWYTFIAIIDIWQHEYSENKHF